MSTLPRRVERGPRRRQDNHRPFGLVSSVVPRNSGATEQLESLCCRVWHPLAGYRRGPQLGRVASWGPRGGAPERCGLTGGAAQARRFVSAGQHRQRRPARGAGPTVPLANRGWLCRRSVRTWRSPWPGATWTKSPSHRAGPAGLHPRHPLAPDPSLTPSRPRPARPGPSSQPSPPLPPSPPPATAPATRISAPQLVLDLFPRLW